MRLLIAVLALLPQIGMAEGCCEAPSLSRQTGEVFRDCAACPELVVVPAGSFMMGAQDGDSDERPVHRATIASPFAIGRYEVTFAEWDLCVSEGGCTHLPVDDGWGRGRRPVMQVSWDDVQLYLAWMSRKTGHDYRLASEAEWEYAARAGADSGQEARAGAGQANCRGCGSRWDDRQTAPVGSFAANGFGLHDMQGNLWEWTADCWNDSHVGAPGDGTPRLDGDCSRRVMRGGSWRDEPWFTRPANRDRYFRGLREGDIGFRVARTL